MLNWGYIFTTLLAGVGIFYGWANPFVGLMIYYAFAILRPTFLWFWAYPGGAAPRYSLFVGLATLAGWTFHSFGNWFFMRAVPLPVICFGIYLLSGLLAWSMADLGEEYNQRSWNALETQLKIGLMLVVTLSLVRDAPTIRTFAWVLVACLAYLAWVFNSQYYFDGYNRVYWRGFGGVDNNGVAMIMVAAVPLAFFMGLHDKRPWVKALCFLAVLLLIHVVLFSFSRGGQLGLIIVGAATFFVTLIGLPRKGLVLLLAALFVAGALRLSGAEVREAFASIFVDAAERDASAASRFSTWSAAWQCIQDHPLGVGPRNFNRVAKLYGVPGKSVHNLFLQTGADYGVIGMLGLAGFYFGTMWQTFRMTRTRTARRLGWPRYFGHMVCISLAGFLLCSMFIGMESVEIAYMVSILGLCTVAYVKRLAASEPAEELPTLPELEEVPAPREQEPAAV